ncbi:MAG: hypothetical protein ACREJX_16745, partial [Polyangiaceae bacterium]
MPTTERYLAYLRRIEHEQVKELERYCSIESGSRDKEGVDRVGAEVRKAWEALGFSTEVIPVHECGNHIVARRKGKGRGRLLAHMHLDTTQPRGTIHEHPV